MQAAEYTHSPTPEDVMAYLDGEETAMSRDAMTAHLSACAICQRVAADLQGVARAAQSWSVAPAPATLRAPETSRGRLLIARIPAWTRSRAAMATLGAAAAVLIVVAATTPTRTVRSMMARPVADQRMQVEPVRPGAPAERSAQIRSRGGSAAAPPIVDFMPALRAPSPRGVVAGQAGQAEDRAVGQATPARGPMVIRTATLRIVVKEFDGVRAAVEAMVAQAGGFLDHLTVSGDTNSARALAGSLRVPSDRMADVLGRLRAMGQVVEDTQGTQEVTDQIIDLDARLASARATEQRLTDLLKNRTGKLSDVLEVERELTRVRLEIEQLDAQKTNLGRRVTYATIGLTISEERKAGLDAGPLSLATRIRVAAADGIEAAIESVVGTLLFLLSAGPVVLLWGGAAAAAWFIVRRARESRPRASE